MGSADRSLWSRDEIRSYWRNYLRTTETYGTMEDRFPEYSLAYSWMKAMGLTHTDLIVDVGCGDQGFDYFLRRKCDWKGQYLGLDGSIDGTELDWWRPTDRAEWYVCLEVLEHLAKPLPFATWLTRRATRGVFVSTPNPEVVDVLDVDPTHVTPITQDDFKSIGYETDTVQLNGRGAGDTLLAWWRAHA